MSRAPRISLAVVAAIVAAVALPAVASGHDYPNGATGRLYEGWGAHRKHLDLGTSANGRRVIQLVVRVRYVCRYRQGGRGYKKVHRVREVLGGFAVRHGSFHSSQVFHPYGGLWSRSVRGRFSRGGRVVNVTFRLRQQFHNELRTGGCDSGKVKLEATRWAPADWRGTTSQDLPISFRLGVFAGDAAPLSAIRVQARLSCDNGQSITRAYDWPAPPDVSLKGYTTDLRPVTHFRLVGQIGASATFEGKRYGTARQGIYIRGTLNGLYESVQTIDPGTGEPTEVVCEAGGIRFKATRR